MASNSRRGLVRRLVDGHPTLFTFGLCGLAGVLVDIDHFASVVIWRYWLPWITEGRLFHTPLFIITSLIICYVYTYLGRLYHKPILIGVGVVVAVITVLVLTFSPLVVWSWSR